MPDYRKIRAFELAQMLSEDIHRLAPSIPARKAPGLRSQLCRSVSSIPANIAEGAGSDTPAEYARLLRVALKSANECAVHLRRAMSVASDGKPWAVCRNRVLVVAAKLNNLHMCVLEDVAREMDKAFDAKRARRARNPQTRGPIR
jgi:four helix bundle protein